MFRLIVLFAALATINAQFITPAITSQNQNIYRSFGNLGQVSAHSKTIDTPFSSVSKSDVRVSNPGIYSGYHGVGVAPSVYGGYGVAPALAPAYARPAVVARPGVVAAPGVGLLGVAYSAAPVVSHMTYTNGLGLSYAW
ncbi:pupal cuticle protein C1B-like [Sitodiplosis mosellana]|uniref:pupal cuticle protein C1B-like n=1 Tax=Sitodiplosis mosellana TaxID=263140 RepID=UPI0024448797|nr:pupal cuticle protein C1B-like [Sitodiplosis mosellana]